MDYKSVIKEHEQTTILFHFREKRERERENEPKEDLLQFIRH